MGGKRKGEEEVPLNYYIGDEGPSEVCWPPQVLWGGYILEGELCILIETSLSLGSF